MPRSTLSALLPYTTLFRSLLGTVRSFDEDPPGVLRRGGLPQRDLRRLAERAGATVVAYATVLQSAWQIGLIGHGGQMVAPRPRQGPHRPPLLGGLCAARPRAGARAPSGRPGGLS